MKRSTKITATLLEVLALVLAHMQELGGVRTDEAKYLLNIPYPHPPLLRTLMSWTEFLPFQEWFWRAFLATLMVQAVWLVWDMGKRFPAPERFALAATWLLSAALITQAGTVMMAPVTALQGLIFVWLFFRTEKMAKGEGRMAKGIFSRFALRTSQFLKRIFRKDDRVQMEWDAFWIATLWFASLFSAYQIILFFPLVLTVLTRTRIAPWKKVVYFLAPIVALAVYTIGNPMAVASFAIHSTKDGTEPLLIRVAGVAWLWLLSGSVFGSVLGTMGIFRSRSTALFGSFLLLAASLVVARHHYYAILFLPLFIAGLMHFFHLNKLRGKPYVPLVAFAMVVMVGWSPPWFIGQNARGVLSIIEREAIKPGPLLISGYFGHEWQYESRTHVVRRYAPALMESASALVCTQLCDDIRKEGMTLVTDVPVEVWVRQ